VLGGRLMKKKIVIIYIVCIHVLLGFALLKSGFVFRVQKKLGISETKKTEDTKHFRKISGFYKHMDDNVPDGAVVFIGDSLIQGLCVSAVVPLSVNYGIAGDTTVGVLKRLPSYRSMRRAGAIVMAIGSNDIKFRTNEQTLQNYRAIAEKMPKNVPVIFSAVLPVDEKAHKDWRGWNQRIKVLNADLQSFISNSKTLFFVDVGHFLVDDKGNLAHEYHVGDGLHLNSKGNAIWIKELQKTIRSARQSAELNGNSSRFHSTR
jgi:lysophospholipase L1-like esterase